MGGDLFSNTLNYFTVEDPKFARFYLLPKIHKRLRNVPGRPVISNCDFCTENISLFLNYRLQPLAQKVNSYIKDTNHFLNKMKKLGSSVAWTLLVFTLTYHMRKILRLSVSFWKLGILNKYQVILWQNLRK